MQSFEVVDQSGPAFGRPAKMKHGWRACSVPHPPQLELPSQSVQSNPSSNPPATMSEEAENEQLTIRIKDGVSVYRGLRRGATTCCGSAGDAGWWRGVGHKFMAGDVLVLERYCDGF